MLAGDTHGATLAGYSGDAHNTQFARSKTVGVRRTEPEATIRHIHQTVRQTAT